jgi:hypothetical protein
VVVEQFETRKPSAMIESQINKINEFYSRHRLRYGNGLDLYFDPYAMDVGLTVKILKHIVKLVLEHNPFK